MIRLRPRGQYAPLATAAAALLLAAFVLAPAFAAEPELQHAKPADVGMDPAGLKKLNEAMHGMVDDGKLAGVVTMVSRKGKVVHFDAYGKRDIENGLPVEKDTIFRIYSMTKPIVGVALMTYYDEGRFTLDDPVSKFIPEFADLKVAKEDGPDGNPITEDADHPMTMRELMSHTAGLTYGLFSRSQVDTLYTQAGIIDFNQDLEEMIDKLAKIPLRQQPGSMWHYSVAVDVQGYILEVLGGKPLDEVLNERLFGPLGMKDTAFWVEPDKVDRFSHMYQSSGGELTKVEFGQYVDKPKFLSGGGGLVGTATDYMRFAQMLANGGELDGVRILRPETVKLMHTDHLPANVTDMGPLYRGNRFGLDFSIVTDPNPATDHERARGEYWWYGIGGTWFGINPEQDLVVVGMIQSRDFQAASAARIGSKRLAYEAIVD
ncbi:MAG: beta-lactamase family protein [Holophagales bacterium]|nr:beta-lactamase family protein [Holophagales bacterium]MYD22741.1 beta-lactamase family protein [Holophagales bacterium]MYI31537.1 beta-lactamase family protein [Holophagales bacterium]